MRIDRAYKGVSEQTLILFDDGMCDGPDLQVGEQYLMYTRRIDDGDVPSRGCTRSRHVKQAAEDLKYLTGLLEAAPTGTVFGLIAAWPEGVGSNQPVPGAMVEMRDREEKVTTTADGEGRYSFDGLKPAKYTVSASKPGFRMPAFESEGVSESLESHGCAVINVILRKDWPGTIEGRVMRSDGTPARGGIDLGLIRVTGRGKNTLSAPLYFEDLKTNDQGKYSFRGVAPGRYKVVLHPCCFPTPETPYPAVYWPAARTEAAASEIRVGSAAVSQHYDFRLPPEVKSEVVSGLVLLPDRVPAKGVRVQILKLPDNAIVGNDSTDEAGHFSFTAMEGLEYSLTGIVIGEHSRRSKALHFSLAKGPHSITLVLDNPGPFSDDRQ